MVRRRAIKLRRVLQRVQRATLAKAVLVLRRSDGCVLVIPSPSGGLALPEKLLDAWVPITTQVEAWLSQLLQAESKLSLVAINGTPAREDVTFLYSATAAKNSNQLWLRTDDANFEP